MTTTPDQTVYVTAGGPEYCYPRTITETTGKDISGDPVTVGLGGYNDPPASMVTPTVDEQGSTSASRVVQLLIDNTVTPANYWLWVKVTDSPEAPIRRTDGRITVI